MGWLQDFKQDMQRYVDDGVAPVKAILTQQGRGRCSNTGWRGSRGACPSGRSSSPGRSRGGDDGHLPGRREHRPGALDRALRAHHHPRRGGARQSLPCVPGRDHRQRDLSRGLRSAGDRRRGATRALRVQVRRAARGGGPAPSRGGTRACRRRAKIRPRPAERPLELLDESRRRRPRRAAPGRLRRQLAEHLLAHLGLRRKRVAGLVGLVARRRGIVGHERRRPGARSPPGSGAGSPAAPS